MRRHFPVLLTALALGMAGSANAQVVVGSPSAPPGPQATHEDVVTRLMSFDRDDDGRIARAELPERMHEMLTRGDGDNNQVLDATEVRRLAASPISQKVAVRGIEAGQYGFGDSFGLDSRLHIEGAIDDLRLAQQDRDKAIEIARRFQETRDQEAKSDLLDTMGQMLTNGALEDFKAAIDRQSPAVVRVASGVVGGGAFAIAAEERFRQLEFAVQRLRAGTNAARLIDKYGLEVAQQAKAHEAINLYNERTSGRLTDDDRSALVSQLDSVLDDRQQDDLRAALDRRPLVKQNGFRFVVSGQQGVVVTPQEVRVQNLVLTTQ